MNIHQDFRARFGPDDHRALAIWAAECAERVLPLFEAKCPADPRPRDALRILREWVEAGRFSMAVVRGASLASHAAARDIKETDAAAGNAARAAGQAVATAHVPTHALGAALYAIKAIAAREGEGGAVALAVAAEREWQRARLPLDLREWVAAAMKQQQRLLPKALRES